MRSRLIRLRVADVSGQHSAIKSDSRHSVSMSALHIRRQHMEAPLMPKHPHAKPGMANFREPAAYVADTDDADSAPHQFD